ncbi:cGMP-inhibited 3',5'-cyclic phosphodiesterase A [Trichonephila clavipes]|nr:cGMP-inhibited 3',5'-cyclic phosphodiesterase A [Trichonephila clavipes]
MQYHGVAGIMINGRTRLHVVANGTMTGQRYIDEVLLPHVRLFRGAVGNKFVFMDDNATCHRTLAVQDCLDSEGIQRLVWPVRSPDLNPIENVWDALGRQVSGRNYPPTNKNTLIRALTEEWDKLPQQLLDNVVQSMASHHHHHHHQQQQQQRDQPQHHHQRRNRRESSVDLAAVTEAHGLVSDMLADPQLPPHILSGLRTLSTLLSPTPASSSSSSCCAPPRMHHRRSPQRRKASLILPYFRSSSDNEEIPFTGERPSALPKRLRKNLAPNVLRRMSTATWTTTTSATGMPTLEPEPLRKRSTSFRNLQSPPPTASIEEQQQYQERQEKEEEEERQFSPGNPPTKGQRSFSTTALPSGHPQRRDSRERKTVASLHPLTPHDVQCLTDLHENATKGQQEQQQEEGQEQQEATIKEEEEDDEEEEDEEEGLPPLPSFRRSAAAMSSDYESSDSPPSGPEDAGGRRILRAHAAVQTGNWTGSGPCTLCGRAAPFTPSPLAVAPPLSKQSTVEEEPKDEGPIIQLPDCVYDLEALANDPLLGLIDIWDFPVFDMERQAGTLILSQMCYRVFLATGLFESFRIPLTPFFAYFHELEKGYRDKPYHNRMHASDVLHGVYFLISQPIPGFVQLPPHSTDSPLHRTLRNSEEDMLIRRHRRPHEQLSEFERGRIIGMMEAGWSVRQVTGLVGRSDWTVRRGWDLVTEVMSFTR